MKSWAVSKPVKDSKIRTTVNTMMTKSDGTSAVKEVEILDGTEAGILMTSLRLSMNLMISTAIKAVMIPRNRPLAPRLLTGMPSPESVEINGVRIMKATTAAIADDSPSSL